MEDNKRVICRPDSPMDGPTDGVMMKTDCIRTDFLSNPNEGEAVFQQSEKSEASITASVELGIFSIRDRASGVMLTIALADAIEMCREAINVSEELSPKDDESEETLQ